MVGANCLFLSKNIGNEIFATNKIISGFVQHNIIYLYYLAHLLTKVKMPFDLI
jgi:hypothetical protein